MHEIKTSAFVILVLCVVLSTAVGAAPGAYLGQTVSSDLRVDGIAVPSGTTVLSPTLVTSGTGNGLLRLDDNSLLDLRPGTAAHLESTPTGGIQVAVRSGTAALERADGQTFQLAANSRMVLDPQGQVLEGETIPMVALCTLDQTKKKWQLIEVPEPEVKNRLAAGDVMPGTAGLDAECNEDDPVVFWTRARKVGFGLGGAVLLGFGIEELNDDDPTSRPASPVTP